MFSRFLNTQVPSILCVVAFIGCCMMFCQALIGARDSASLNSEVLHGMVLWGALSLLAMLAFCLCLAIVTRYRRSLPDEARKSGAI